MAKEISPLLVASTIAGGGFGVATGFLTADQREEEQGAAVSQQLKSSLGTGVRDGVIGAGIGMGVSGTALALHSIFKKR